MHIAMGCMRIMGGRSRREMGGSERQNGWLARLGGVGDAGQNVEVAPEVAGEN